MKTSVCAQLASLIVKETFGDCVADVVLYLIRKVKSPFRGVCSGTKLSQKQVRLCLTIGIQHNYIFVSKHPRGFNEYSVDINAILHRLRYPSYVYCIKLLYGNVSEVLIEEILHHGQILHSQLIPRTINKLKKNVKEQVSNVEATEKLEVLIKARFVEICPDMETVEEGDSGSHSPPSKRARTEINYNDRCYRVSSLRFSYYHRDLQMVEAFTRKLGHKHGEILSTMLRLSEVKSAPAATESAVITSNEVFNTLPQHLCITSRAVLDVYMMTMVNDEMKMLVKVGDDGGGSYIIDYSQAMTALAIANAEALVLERFGSKSLRLFRLLILKQHLEQKQLEEMAMIPTKDAKQLLYNMYTHRFISTTDISKTADHAASRTFYCFKVPMEHLGGQLREANYKSILNLMSKRIQILSDNRRLLDKQQKMEAIIATLGEDEADQKAEIEAMTTPSEQQQLQAVKNQTNRLENGELQLASTTLTWDMFLTYKSTKRLSSLPQPKTAAK
ncbi:DNA-directed RNA polymerase III subunit RPC3-like isoform X1 [Watersipora subatra]|uniref:DNA-directed RNA polymerase III subunit RPC3-like isoform X1 n=1 Tax=Watersipora subatra TaxID=2589382 RepID=UPI00355B3705